MAMMRVGWSDGAEIAMSTVVLIGRCRPFLLLSPCTTACTAGSCSLQVRRPVALAAHQCASVPCVQLPPAPPRLQPLAAHLEALLLHHHSTSPPALIIIHHSIALASSSQSPPRDPRPRYPAPAPRKVSTFAARAGIDLPTTGLLRRVPVRFSTPPPSIRDCPTTMDYGTCGYYP